ncbi:FAD-dependent oxidoreductase [Bradyrhizobium sp. USDA 4502]
MSPNQAIKLAVIGRGLIGSAAARHLSKMGHDVALIGPDEPAGFFAPWRRLRQPL